MCRAGAVIRDRPDARHDSWAAVNSPRPRPVVSQADQSRVLTCENHILDKREADKRIVLIRPPYDGASYSVGKPAV
jgi:hypothetical protein